MFYKIFLYYETHSLAILRHIINNKISCEYIKIIFIKGCDMTRLNYNKNHICIYKYIINMHLIEIIKL